MLHGGIGESGLPGVGFFGERMFESASWVLVGQRGDGMWGLSDIWNVARSGPTKTGR